MDLSRPYRPDVRVINGATRHLSELRGLTHEPQDMLLTVLYPGLTQLTIPRADPDAFPTRHNSLAHVVGQPSHHWLGV